VIKSTIDGYLAQPVEIRRAAVTQDKLTLFGRGLDGPPTADRGAGVVFFDDAGGGQVEELSPLVEAESNYNASGNSISVSFTSKGEILWSGTLTRSNPSVTFAGTVTDGSSPALNIQETIGSWSPS
jgi:hypothetical protein